VDFPRRLEFPPRFHPAPVRSAVKPVRVFCLDRQSVYQQFRQQLRQQFRRQQFRQQ
jgi:hypothetical protein